MSPVHIFASPLFLPCTSLDTVSVGRMNFGFSSHIISRSEHTLIRALFARTLLVLSRIWDERSLVTVEKYRARPALSAFSARELAGGVSRLTLTRR